MVQIVSVPEWYCFAKKPEYSEKTLVRPTHFRLEITFNYENTVVLNFINLIYDCMKKRLFLDRYWCHGLVLISTNQLESQQKITGKDWLESPERKPNVTKYALLILWFFHNRSLEKQHKANILAFKTISNSNMLHSLWGKCHRPPQEDLLSFYF